MQFELFNLGLVDFKTGEWFQNKVFGKVKEGKFISALILCQHYPVITLGRSANIANILISQQELENRAIPVYHIQRGGDVTYHGPGQVIVYPIFNLSYLKKDVHLFLRYLEDVAIDLLWDFGIKALRRAGLTGVWVNGKKIASIGIAIRNWTTLHGLSINIKKNDLDNFRFIRPCGLDIQMISLENILNKEVKIEKVKNIVIEKFNAHWGMIKGE